MTDYLPALHVLPTGTEHTEGVISVVVSRPSSVLRTRRWSANSRRWREGTDPASRGRRGPGAGGRPAGGVA